MIKKKPKRRRVSSLCPWAPTAEELKENLRLLEQMEKDEKRLKGDLNDKKSSGE